MCAVRPATRSGGSPRRGDSRSPTAKPRAISNICSPFSTRSTWSIRCPTTCRRCGIRARPATGPVRKRTHTTRGRTALPCAVRADGPLRGRTVVIKDNIMVADVPMANGSRTLEGYVPEVDATVVTRILDAGGTIVGKATCEGLCLSGGSHTSATGPVHNPHRRGHSAGGSSSGCAVLVALGEVDMAVGCDQGGSIRMPSSFCGTVGMKPTFGLVPYTGIMPIEITADHVGPMTADVVGQRACCSRCLAGPDGLDPRQIGSANRAVHRRARAWSGRPARRRAAGRFLAPGDRAGRRPEGPGGGGACSPIWEP